MTLLEHWRASGLSFAEGVRLLIQNGGGKHLTKLAFDRLKALAIFNDTPDAYNLGKLEYAMQRTPFEAADADTTIELIAGTEPSEPLVKTITFKSELPPEPVPHGIKSLHKRRDYHHAIMSTATTKEERATHAEEVLSLSRQLDAAYDQWRNPPGEQTDTPEPSDSPEPTAADLRKLASLRARASRLKNKLIPAATSARKAQLEKELTIKQAEIRSLEEKTA